MSKYSPSGDPYTRGHMDSYYHRPKKPHSQIYGVNELGNQSILQDSNLTEQELADAVIKNTSQVLPRWGQLLAQ